MKKSDKIGLLLFLILLAGLFLEWNEGFSLGQITITGTQVMVVIVLVWYNLSERPEFCFMGTVIEGFNVPKGISTAQRRTLWKVKTTTLETNRVKKPIRVTIKDDVANIGYREVVVHEYGFYYPNLKPPIRDGPHPLFGIISQHSAGPRPRLLLGPQGRTTVFSRIDLPEGLFKVQITVVATTIKVRKTIWCYSSQGRINWLEPGLLTRMFIRISGNSLPYRLLH